LITSPGLISFEVLKSFAQNIESLEILNFSEIEAKLSPSPTSYSIISLLVEVSLLSSSRAAFT